MKPETRAMSKIELLKEKSRQAELGGGPERIAKQKAGGKMTARERIEFFLDEGQLRRVR
jgi:acetyl-CoA carboxylase carboxyltransferase component